MEYQLIAKTFQGLEPILAQELTELGASDIQIGRRMVSFTGDKAMLYRANFCLRTAIRILKPIKNFKARSADEVYAAVKSIDWTEYLDNNTTFAVDSVVFSPEFTHSKFVAYKVKDAIADQFREKTGNRPNISVANPDLQLHIHISDYDATLALDSSGESLHRRGYRQESVSAPINEVLAAGMIMMTGWKGDTDFIDPFCGSGTIAIEAALIALGIAPGVFRQNYAFEKWPDFDKELFDEIYNDDSNDKEFTHRIIGRDIDPKAVGIARRNVKAAGLSKYIEIEEQDFANFKQPQSPALIVTNPPYGERISSPDLMGLYRMIGQKLKREFVGGEAWIISYHEECFEHIGLKPSLKTPLFNGALECELRKYQMFQGRYNEHRAAGGEIKTTEERKQMAEKHRFKQHRQFKGERNADEETDFQGKEKFENKDHHFNKFTPREGRKFGNRDGGNNSRESGRNSREGGRNSREGGRNSRESGRNSRDGRKSRDFRDRQPNRDARREARRKYFDNEED